jgi:hypothetical protein
MTLPLKEEAVLPKPKVYKLSRRDQQFVDKVHDELHQRGKMVLATQHMPTAHPVFIVWKNNLLEDGSTERVGSAVVDSCGFYSVLKTDFYPSTTIFFSCTKGNSTFRF